MLLFVLYEQGYEHNYSKFIMSRISRSSLHYAPLVCCSAWISHILFTFTLQKIPILLEYKTNLSEIKEVSGNRDERCRGCLGVTVDNLGDMTVDVLLASVPSASTLPGASVELGQRA